MNQATATPTVPADSDAVTTEIQEVLGDTPILSDPLPPTVTDDPTGEDDDDLDKEDIGDDDPDDDRD